MRLYIGNKNYSSWSLRPWLLLRQAGIAFEETRLSFGDISEDGPFKREARKLSPTARVPVLEDGALRIWDSLAIAEYLAEKFPEKQLWPADAGQRAQARCVVAELHAGFGALRTAFPMNIELNAPEIGPRVLKEKPAAAADLARIDQIFSQGKGPWLFGGFGIADAYYAPIASHGRKDEVGELAVAFRGMQVGVAASVSKLTELAHRDALTGLPHPWSFRRAERETKKKKRPRTRQLSGGA